MAKVTDTTSGKSVEIKDGESIASACEQLGVPFSCHEGTCGICGIEVVEGEENLTPLTSHEQDLGKSEKHRLACQCSLKQGELKFKSEN